MKAILAGLLVAGSSVAAQQRPIEYGRPKELAGVHRIYIYTGSRLEDQQEIADKLQEKIPGLEIVARPTDAEVIVEFGSSSSVETIGAWAAYGEHSAYAQKVRETTDYGSGWIYRITPEGHLRLLLHFEGSKRRGTIWKKPRSKFINAVVDAFEEANQ